jgi:DNA mismatch endonuclease (patch repair protein)
MDTITKEQRSRVMQRVRAKDSRPEMIVRRIVHHLGFRYRLHRADLPGKPDLTFAGQRKIIFVHGCFWHLHPSPACKLARRPKSRLEFWNAKLEGNRARDRQQIAQLRALGWSVLTIWECELKDATRLEETIKRFLIYPAGEYQVFQNPQ